MDTLIRTFLWVLHVSLTASIAAILVILVLKLFNNHIGVRLQHALLFIIIIRLIIPVNIQSNISLFNILFGRYENKTLNIGSNTNFTYDFLREGKVYLNDKQKDKTVSKISYLEKTSNDKEKIKKENAVTYVLNIASFVWLMGVFITTLFFFMVVWKVKRKTSNLKKLNDLKVIVLMEECKKKADVNKNIPIYACDNFKSPCIVGILNPKIYIPKYAYITKNYKQLSHILLHELIHYKRKDLFYNFLGTIALLIHWFNPIIWFSVKRMKLQREYACDAYVLEILGEEEAIEYGMNLINFSKLFSKDCKTPQLAIFFETKNQIKRRIKMIKKFKKGSYRMSAAAVICCVIAGGIVFTNGVNAKNVKSDTVVTAAQNNDSVKKQESKFIIDSPVKVYDNLKKAEEISGLKFKIPDYIPANYVVDPGFVVIKISDKDNSLKISFQNRENGKVSNNFDFQVSKGSMEECLKQIAENENKKMQNVEIPNTVKNQKEGKVEISKEAMNLEGINGSNITIKSILPGNYQKISKFFVWQNEGMWYSIEYNQGIQGSKNHKKFMDVSTDEVGKVASSIKHIEDAKNVNYSVKRDVSTEISSFTIYDKEDLKRAKELLGFDPKLPLNINKDITIKGSAVGISGDSDIENKKINYELNTFYNLNKGSLTFWQGRTSKTYDSINKNGYVEVQDASNKSKQLKVQTLKINDKEVFKYEDSFETEPNKQTKSEEYVWKENGFYCEVSIYADIENPDEIAKDFVNSKPID
ncbi:M56 family metallopeptidase [Clostridium sp. JS66]|uniref:M56 family metallopeptidase n=1 Tax=Clostridium sp. JS66 TaxID=3064705 RepID=UPI00298DC6F1|nr:M56 family metallopeptidase [Clostridium sp. JS66]WPC43519.1 M56 family metallopeptidase [Clostridium sp. JS66]